MGFSWEGTGGEEDCGEWSSVHGIVDCFKVWLGFWNFSLIFLLFLFLFLFILIFSSQKLNMFSRPYL